MISNDKMPEKSKENKKVFSISYYHIHGADLTKDEQIEHHFELN